jgi:hypothetical protein
MESSTGGVKSVHAKPNRKDEDSDWASDCKGRLNSGWTKSRTDSVEPNRAQLLIESADPRCTKSITDRENTEPSRDIPNTEIVEPNRTQLRMDSAAPRCTKSNTDRDDPKLAKLRKDSVDPKFVKSSTDREEPKREVL